LAEQQCLGNEKRLLFDPWPIPGTKKSKCLFAALRLPSPPRPSLLLRRGPEVVLPSFSCQCPALALAGLQLTSP
jgi:hypothetical protein